MQTILIVDDEETIRFSFGSILADRGFKVVQAADMGQADRIIRSTALDVAVVDRLLGPDDGMALAARLRERQPHCTIILVSAYPTFQSACQGFDHQVFAYLQKPVRKARLCRVVADAARCSSEKREMARNGKFAAAGMLSSGVIHDFNNLFTVISGYAEMADSRLPGDNPAAAQLKTIRKAVDRGQRIAGKYFEFMRREDKGPSEVRAASLVNDTLEFLRLVLPKSVEITTNRFPEDARVNVRRTQIEQCLINIADNAVRAMPDRTGTLQVDVDGPGPEDSVQITLRDNGCGMDPHTLSQVFTPFFSTKPGGTGLGLSTTQKIIQDHGGRITASSRPGKGSCFHICLPAASSIEPKTGGDTPGTDNNCQGDARRTT